MAKDKYYVNMPEILRGSERIAAGRGKEAIEAAHNNEIKAFME